MVETFCAGGRGGLVIASEANIFQAVIASQRVGAKRRPMTGSAKQSFFKEPNNVIASEAKQSILSLRGEMDCFASLAMTASRHALSSRRATRPRF